MNRRDPGLQPERTALAWRRTELSLLVVVLLVGRVGATNLGWGVTPLVGAMTVTIVVIRSAGRSRQPEKPLTDGWPVAAVAAAVCGLAVLEIYGTLGAHDA